MAHTKNHEYHILPPSIWPLLTAISAFLTLAGCVLWMKDAGSWLFLAAFAALIVCMFSWFSDMRKEGNTGQHTEVIRIGLRMGFLMFIVSEIFFFAAWFWMFFKHELFPMSDVNPIDVELIDPFHLPLINTLLLLLSGCFVTWAHHDLSEHGNNAKAAKNLLIGILLGMAFTFFQAFEYYEAIVHEGIDPWSHVETSTFFMATGFHGFHVIVGTIFLIYCMVRARNNEFTKEAHVGFEAAAWYWHFVDVVWLFLFVAVYIWGR